MKTCIIHVGMHKTGTKSIQKSLFDFEDASFYYARMGGRSNHSRLVYNLFSEKPIARKRWSSLTADEMDHKSTITKSELLESIRSAGGRKLIISGESIGVLSKAGLESLRDWLKPHFDDIRVIAYVRPPMGYMSSAFQQKARDGDISSLETGGMYRSYRKSFEKFDEVFGNSSVTLRLFDRDALVKGDVVADFCAMIGLDLPPERVVKANESWPRDGICLRVQYNRYCRDNGITPVRGKIGPVLGAIDTLGTEKFRLSPLLLGPIVKANQQDIDWINTRMGVNFGADESAPGPRDIASWEDILATVPNAREILLNLFDEFHIEHPKEDVPDGGLIHMLSMAIGGKAGRRSEHAQARKRGAVAGDVGNRSLRRPRRLRAEARRRRRAKSSDTK